MIEARVTFANEDDYAWFLEIMQEACDASDLDLPLTITKVYLCPPGGNTHDPYFGFGGGDAS